MDRSLVKARADFVSVIEAMYAPEPDPKEWAHSLTLATRDITRAPIGLGLVAVAHEDDYANPTLVLGTATEGLFDSAVEHLGTDALRKMDSGLFRTFYYPGQPVVTHADLEPRLSPDLVPVLRTFQAIFGARDALGVLAYPEPGLVVILWATLGQVGIPATWERHLFELVAGHLDSALRLRTQPELAVAAVLSPSGALLDIGRAEEAGPAREWLAARVVAIEASRLRQRRREPEAIDDWHALFAGRYSLVPRDDNDGKRYYLLIDNSPTAQAHARFTKRQGDVVRMAARGFTGKGVAYSLGISPTTVSQTLGAAAAKIGLRSRLELVRVAAAMFGAPCDSFDSSSLTPAEHDVRDLLRRGLSNADIARLRERSLSTVANQVSSMLRKTGTPSRRALAAATPR